MFIRPRARCSPTTAATWTSTGNHSSQLSVSKGLGASRFRCGRRCCRSGADRNRRVVDLFLRITVGIKNIALSRCRCVGLRRGKPRRCHLAPRRAPPNPPPRASTGCTCCTPSFLPAALLPGRFPRSPFSQRALAHDGRHRSRYCVESVRQKLGRERPSEVLSQRCGDRTSLCTMFTAGGVFTASALATADQAGGR